MSLLRQYLRLPFAIALAVAASSAFAAADKSVVTTEHVRAELMAQAPEGVQPGKPVWVGLQIKHQPEWHTYWKNAGDSGLPTQLEWQLPAGLKAGDIAWPVPRKIPIGNLANYGYEGTVLLPVPLTVGEDFKPSAFGQDVDIKLKAQWLVCRKECVPEEGEFAIRLPLRSSTALHAADFKAALDSQPQPLGGKSSVEVGDASIKVSVTGLPSSAQGKQLEFFPEIAEVIETAAPWTQAWQGDKWTATVPLSVQRSQSPTVLPIVLSLGNAAWRTEAAVSGKWPDVAAASGVSPALQAALRDSGGQKAVPLAPANVSTSLIAALLGALVGGLILNLMPCVFPILAIKVVSFTKHASDRHGHRVSGLAYSVGVVLSFVALGAVMLGLRSAGEQLGWGFQLQSPAVVAALSALFTLIALNFCGLFEFGAILPSRVATLEARHPVANSFLSGVLAVAVASPCTAPFMGASLGFAIGLPAVEALLVFGAIGVGMAAPYLLASWFPAVARLLPRPGPWMETFRRLMAFPMFATVAWLVWVLGQQSGIDGAGALLALLVALSMVVWALTLRGNVRIALGALAAAFLAFVAWQVGPNITRPAPSTNTLAESGWQAWEPGRVDQLVASGQPVFVDFTAAWCVTCQYNKRTTLSREDVMGDFAAKKVALLRADWTRRDPAITAALAQLGRNGVPVYVFYSAGKAPIVLSEVLSTAEVRAAIAQL